MLHDFVTAHADEVIARARDKVTHRGSPPVSPGELENGLPLFLRQLSETLRCEATATPCPADALAASAALHGGELMALGFTASQVVHDYGDLCQAITELALEHQAPIGTDEFHTLNRCLDTAIAEAVTEHARLTAERTGTDEIERLGQVAHELRNLLSTALLAFQTLKHGAVAINGSTGMVLGRSLVGLRDVIDSTLTEVRLGSGTSRRERLSVAGFVDEVAVVANLHAEYRNIHFLIEPVDRDLAVNADPQMLASAVTNLLTNAFKYTRPGGRVVLSVNQERQRVMINVEDECGGIPDSPTDRFQPFGERRGRDRTGLGLGLSIARKAVKAHGGEIHIRNIPGTGCIFTIEVPAAEQLSQPPAVL